MPEPGEKVALIGDWQGLAKPYLRTRASGKERVTVSIRSEPVVANLDNAAAAKPFAEIITAGIKNGIRNISGIVSPATQLFRERAGRAFDQGARWAKQRYSGGRTPAKRPGSASTVRPLSDSGRLHDTIATGSARDGSSWNVNVAANRLGPDPGVRMATLRLLMPIIEAVLTGQPMKDAAKNLARQIVRQEKDSLLRLLKETVKAGQQVGQIAQETEEKPGR